MYFQKKKKKKKKKIKELFDLRNDNIIKLIIITIINIP